MHVIYYITFIINIIALTILQAYFSKNLNEKIKADEFIASFFHLKTMCLLFKMLLNRSTGVTIRQLLLQ